MARPTACRGWRIRVVSITSDGSGGEVGHPAPIIIRTVPGIEVNNPVPIQAVPKPIAVRHHVNLRLVAQYPLENANRP